METRLKVYRPLDILRQSCRDSREKWASAYRGSGGSKMQNGYTNLRWFAQTLRPSFHMYMCGTSELNIRPTRQGIDDSERVTIFEECSKHEDFSRKSTKQSDFSRFYESFGWKPGWRFTARSTFQSFLWQGARAEIGGRTTDCWFWGDRLFEFVFS